MINCIALDDEPMALEVLKKLCEKIPSINLTHTFTQVSLAQKHLRKFPVDLIFLDIEMPNLNGLEFYKTIEQESMVIFTTAYSQYAVEGFNVNAIDYLLKPISFKRLEKACLKANQFFALKTTEEATEQKCLYVRSEYSLVKIFLEDIIYLETMDDYIKIFTQDGNTILTLMSMKKILEKLPSNEFSRIHRSYTVSNSKILSVRGNLVELETQNIPIGRSYKKEFLQKYTSKN